MPDPCARYVHLQVVFSLTLTCATKPFVYGTASASAAVLHNLPLAPSLALKHFPSRAERQQGNRKQNE